MTISKKSKRTASTKSTKTTKSIKPKQQIIYIGPTLSQGRLSFATVFLDEIPAYVQAIVEKHPWFKNLLVPVDEMTKAIASTQDKGSYLNILYNKVKKEV